MRTLRELRQENALAIRDLAEKAGVSPTTISSIESGKPARPSTKRAICKVFKVRPQDIDWNLTYRLP
jgi:DNA-binding XRE family transcriptional regulator